MRSPSYKQCILATIEHCSLLWCLYNAYSLILILDEAVGYNMQYPILRLLSSCLLGPTSHIKSEPVYCVFIPSYPTLPALSASAATICPYCRISLSVLSAKYRNRRKQFLKSLNEAKICWQERTAVEWESFCVSLSLFINKLKINLFI